MLIFLIQIISCFILDRKKRKAFREEWFDKIGAGPSLQEKLAEMGKCHHRWLNTDKFIYRECYHAYRYMLYRGDLR
jgi:hypothetical protein